MGKYKEGDEVMHLKPQVQEIVVGECKIKFNGEWVNGIIYKGIDRYTNEPMTFVREINDFENEFMLVSELPFE